MFAILLLGIFLLLIAIFPGSIFTLADKVEQSLLNQRLRYRSEFLTPADDIIVVALDRRTDEWRRTNPQQGWSGTIPPRRYLADLVNYLSNNGARAIALDVILMNEQTEQDDRTLEEALRKAGNVYIGAYLHEPLREYLLQKPRMDRSTSAYYSKIAFFTRYLEPYLKQQAKRSAWLPAPCSGGIESLGFEPYFQLSDYFPLPDNSTLSSRKALGKIWRQVCNAEADRRHNTPGIIRNKERFAQLMASIPAQKGRKDFQEVFARNCLVDEYENSWQNSKSFLRELERHRVDFEYRETPDNRVEQAYTYCDISPVLPRFMKAAAGIGITSIDYDQDAFLRQVPLFYKSYKGNYYTMLAARAALHNTASERPLLSYSRKNLKLGNKLLPLVDERNVLLNWHDPKLLVEKTYQRNMHAFQPEEALTISSEITNSQLGYGHIYRIVSVSDILKKIHNPADPDTPSLYNIYGDPASGLLSFKDKWIIYGDTMEDKHRTPVGNVTFGPEVMATVLDMVLHDTQFVTAAPLAVTLGVVLLVSGLIAFAVIGLPRIFLGSFSGLLMIAVFWAYNFWLFGGQGLFIPIVWPTFAFSMVFIGSLVYRYYVQDREKRQLTGVFSKFVSPQVMGNILASPANAMENLRGSRKELTVLFSDIHNFTSNFENEEPERIVQQLNEYFNVMTSIVLKHGGTYDKYMGDALMAFFGAPTEFPDHAERACRAALEMQAALEPLNEKWRQLDRPVLKHGIGISTGPVFVGYFGSDDIKNFTVIGANVNLGSRLETHTRQVDADILISRRTYEQVKDWADTQDLGQIPIKGFTHPVPVYALHGEKNHSAPQPPDSQPA